MPTWMTIRLTKLRERWGKITRPQQIAIIAGVVVTVAMLVGFLVWSQQTPYSVLFSNLQSQDASNIVNQLKSQKIPYQISDGGAAILVPSSVVDETRLMLAGNGLPSQGTVGFEIFDKSNPLGMTDFTQQLDYQRALQGELTRTIQQVRGVNQAWVNLVLPQSSLYTATQQNPTASVTLRLNSNTTLDPGQIKAIMHLVSSAVQGLKLEDVTVVDTDGHTLSDEVLNTLSNTGVTLATVGNALDVERSYEQKLSQQATSMLNDVLGPAKAVVNVNANLNWDQIQQDSTLYGQAPNPIANQTTNSISSNGQSGTPTSGPPGTGTNLVPTPTATTNGTNSSYNQTQSNTVYNVSQTVQHLTKAPGSVQRLTVAVFVDGQFSTQTLGQLQESVANAVGLNTTRGDQITITALPFNRSVTDAAQAALQASQQQAQQEAIIRGIALIIASLAMVIFAIRATRKRPARQVASPSIMLLNEAADTMMEATHVPGQEAEAEGTRIDPETGLILTSPDADLSKYQGFRPLSDEEQERQVELKRELFILAKEHPDMIAGVIINWFDEG
jgi:flagellar M-ring protein FliF